MIYKFKSKAAGDVIMLGPNGDQVMRLLGREPAPQGIFEAAGMPAVMAALEAAVTATWLCTLYLVQGVAVEICSMSI